jgi:hypothetical protein
VAQKKRAPFAVGARIGIMPNGYSLVPGIVLTLEQNTVGSWYGNVRTSDGVLENRSFHPDYVLKESTLEASTREVWAPHWKRLEAEGAE